MTSLLLPILFNLEIHHTHHRPKLKPRFHLSTPTLKITNKANMPKLNSHSNTNIFIIFFTLFPLLISQAHLVTSNGYPNSALTNPLKTNQIPPETAAGAGVDCGKTGECSAEEDVTTVGEEFEMESEITKRVLMMQQQQRRYISYDTLRRDTVPCTTPGASYYNCGAGPTSANRYHRGCQVITKCSRNF